MSVPSRTRRTSVADIGRLKGERPLVALTAYTAPMASLLDVHADLILVGDSVGMVVYGFDNTLSVTLDMMIAHGRAVVRASKQAFIVVDLPFASYQESREQAFRSAARLISETGAQAVKLEGGEEMAETIAFLVARGVPVMGHVGLTPQQINVFGGFRAQGRDEARAARIRADARAVADAGAFAFVLEGTVEPLAREIVADATVPVIGIGASPACDGQILVTEDMLGLFGAFRPRHAKRFAELGEEVDKAAARYAEEVKTRRFPGPEHVF